MKFSPNIHLAYSTNIHPAESWEETFDALRKYTNCVRKTIVGSKRFGIGLRLSARAAKELQDKSQLLSFRKWLDENNSYVFTINGFPYGEFHNTCVKEKVFLPDWSSEERLEYTKVLFDILSEIVPEDCDGSVSTMPISFKEFNSSPEKLKTAKANLLKCVDYIEKLADKKKRVLHLGIEPEPLGLVETTSEFVVFFGQLLEMCPDEAQLKQHLGINYDCCHIAIEYEDANDAITRLVNAGIKVSKIHLSCAISVIPTKPALKVLKAFSEPTYLHQTIIKTKDGSLIRVKDLDIALKMAEENRIPDMEEWRIHFHIPLYSIPEPPIRSTLFHIQDVMDILKKSPSLCSHFEIETYTFNILPESFKDRNVVEQLIGEYNFVINEFNTRGLI